jgi:hypothetical protein
MIAGIAVFSGHARMQGWAMPNSDSLWAPGTPGYILLKAGLFEPDGHYVTPTGRLTGLINPVPDGLLPILVDMAWYTALLPGRAIDTLPLRWQLVDDLKKLGLRHKAIGHLFKAVAIGAEKAAEERRQRPAALPG